MRLTQGWRVACNAPLTRLHAAAVALDAALLFKGEDFARIDVRCYDIP